MCPAPGIRALAALVLVASCTPTAPTVPIAPASPRALAAIEASHDLDGVLVGTTTARGTFVFVFASWCPHCKDELRELDAVRASHPDVRWLGINYKGHEEYDQRGSSEAIRALATTIPWLRIVPIDDDVFAELGRPPLIPTIFIYDRAGTLVATFDRREREPPSSAELARILSTL
jgi:thiol-disulfide isomerase/thioredoxin